METPSKAEVRAAVDYERKMCAMIAEQPEEWESRIGMLYLSRTTPWDIFTIVGNAIAAAIRDRSLPSDKSEG